MDIFKLLFLIDKHLPALHFIRRINWRSKYKSKNPIIARHACLGTLVLQTLHSRFDVINVQKGRIDYLLECWKDHQMAAKATAVLEYLQQEESISWLLQEEILYDWLKPENPVGLFMDSWAELADQEFKYKSGKWSFLSTYGDLNHTEKFDRNFISNGLLPIEKFEEYFKIFFNKVRSLYGNLPIFYLHFPYKLESREKFRERGIALKRVLDKLAEEDLYLFSISVEEDVVDWDELRTPEMWDFAYHYNPETTKRFAELVLSTGYWPV
jgi:hypothetical protein